MEYLINVALGFTGTAVALIVFYVILLQVIKRIPQLQERYGDQITDKRLRPWLYITLVINLAFVALNPAITYKHETFDNAREIQNVEQLNAQKHNKVETLEIKDNTKPIEGVGDEEFDSMVEFNNDGRD